jgi:hypothetical protein
MACSQDIGQGVNAALSDVMILATSLDEAQSSAAPSAAPEAAPSTALAAATARRTMAHALDLYGARCAPEAEAVARIAQIGFPYGRARSNPCPSPSCPAAPSPSCASARQGVIGRTDDPPFLLPLGKAHHLRRDQADMSFSGAVSLHAAERHPFASLRGWQLSVPHHTCAQRGGQPRSQPHPACL